MSKIKILQLRSSLGFFGAENVIVELCKSLANSMYHPIIGVINNSYNSHTEMVEAANRYDLETKIFECKSQFSLRTILDIRKFITQNNIKIIHSHGYKSNFYATFSTLFQNVSQICTCHPWLETDINLKAKFYTWLDRNLLLKRFDKIVAVSNIVKEEIAAHGAINKDRVSIINNGIDIHRFSKSYNKDDIYRKYNLIPSKKIIGTIGRLSCEKGQKYLIEAIKIITDVNPDVNLLIVGDGPLNKELKQKVKELNLEDFVIFTGVINSIPEILSLMDIFILPSISEGLPMVLLEAMAAKKPIITTRVGAIPLLIIDNETGILIETQNHHQLAKKITELINDKIKADFLARNAYQKVVNEFSSDIMVNQYIQLYNEIVSGSVIKN